MTIACKNGLLFSIEEALSWEKINTIEQMLRNALSIPVFQEPTASTAIACESRSIHFDKIRIKTSAFLFASPFLTIRGSTIFETQYPRLSGDSRPKRRKGTCETEAQGLSLVFSKTCLNLLSDQCAILPLRKNPHLKQVSPVHAPNLSEHASIVTFSKIEHESR